MTFSPECLWAFQTRATFWAIFETFPFVPPLHFFRKCGFWVTLWKLPYVGHSGTFGAAVCAKIFSSLCNLSAQKLDDNNISARVLLGLWNDCYVLGDFLKIFLGPPFALFRKMLVLGHLLKIAITWPFGRLWSCCLSKNLLQSLHYKVPPLHFFRKFGFWVTLRKLP